MPSFSVMYSVTPAASPCTSARLLSLPSSSSCCVLPDVADSAMIALPPVAPPAAMESALSKEVVTTSYARFAMSPPSPSPKASRCPALTVSRTVLLKRVGANAES